MTSLETSTVQSAGRGRGVVHPLAISRNKRDSSAVSTEKSKDLALIRRQDQVTKAKDC